MTRDEELDLVADVLEHVVDALGLEAEVAVEDADGVLRGTLEGEDLGLFIGRHGQTIDAVQHLVQRALVAATGEQRRAVVDAEGYRERRGETLERLADEAAAAVESTEEPARMEPMTASERRHVHEYLRERGGLTTHSEGDEPHRHLVVSREA